MKLPVTAANSEDGIWRRFADVAIDHALAAGEEWVVPGARAVGGDDAESKRLPGLVILPEHVGNDDGVRSVLAEFDERGSVRPRWFDPRSDATSDVLARAGYVCRSVRLLRLRSAPAAIKVTTNALIVSARAARPAYADWCGQRATESPAATMLPRHVDDPQYEAYVALREGKAVAAAGLQIRGQTGLVSDVFVRPDARRQGLASLLIGRVSDLAARAQLAEIFAIVDPSDDAAVRTATRAGFAVVREFTEWALPAARAVRASMAP